jgi:hypothetical protein
MREIRPSGSEGGAGETRSYLYRCWRPVPALKRTPVRRARIPAFPGKMQRFPSSPGLRKQSSFFIPSAL